MYDSLLDALQSGTTVVTANNRLARTLRNAYEQHQMQQGRQAWQTPVILTWSAWLQTLWQESRLRGGNGANYQLLSDSAASLLWQSVIRADREPDDTQQVAQLARAARLSWGLLNDWQALEAEEWTRPDLSPDQKAWLRWSGQYRDGCRQRGQTDPERLGDLLRQDIAAGLFDDLPPLLFCGFDSWAPARRALVDAAVERGLTVAETANSADQSAPAGPLLQCADPGAELRAAADWARRILDEEPAARVGVVVPDLSARAADVRRVFLDALAPDWRLHESAAGVALNVSYGEPLANVAVIAAALNVLRIARGKAEFDELSALLRSRWLSGGAEQASQRAELELRLRERLRIECSLTSVLAECRREPAVAALIERLLEHSRQQDRRSMAQWAESFASLLEAIGWPGSDSLDSRTWQSLQAWHEVLRDLAAAGAVLAKVTRGEALAALSQLLQQRLFQPEGRADGVQVMGVLEAAGHRFDHLWVCGMARELWPAPARPDPFVPLELQQRLRMPDAIPADTIDRARAQAERLCHSATRLVVSMPRLAEGELLTASPFFATSALAEPDAIAPNWNEVMLAGGSTATLTADPAPAWPPGDKVRGGASVLNLQAVSPLNAFIEKRLGAMEMPLPAVGIDPRQRGNLTHKALEALYSAAPGRQQLEALGAAGREAALRAALEAGTGRLPGMDDPFMQALAKAEVELQLQRLLAFVELDLARAAFDVVECEAAHSVSIGPLSLELKLDRLDRLADGSQLVLDYKTGMVKRQNWNPDKPRDLQLPLYVTCVVPDAAGIAFAQVSSRGIAYDGVGMPDLDIPGMRCPGTNNRSEVKFNYPGRDEVILSWDELRRVWAEQLAELAGQFAAGDFRLDPLNPDSARGQFAVLSRVFDEGPRLTEAEA